jgi:hypothetical protein
MTRCRGTARPGRIGDPRWASQWKALGLVASPTAPARQSRRARGRRPPAQPPEPTESPAQLANANGGSQLPVVVPSLPNGSQSDKHLYGTNSSAGRVA